VPAIQYTHPIRIWRADPDQKHDLHVVIGFDDIYGEDKWGRLMPDDDLLISPNQMGIVAGTAQLWVPRGIDIAPGYFVQVKKPRVLNGQREAVMGKLTDTAAVAETTLYVTTTVGFESGDLVVLSSSDTQQQLKVKTVKNASLVVYEEDELRSEFAAADDVVAGHFYRVTAQRTPHAVGPIQVVSLSEAPFISIND